jgi:hypothetical protein
LIVRVGPIVPELDPISSSVEEERYRRRSFIITAVPRTNAKDADWGRIDCKVCCFLLSHSAGEPDYNWTGRSLIVVLV